MKLQVLPRKRIGNTYIDIVPDSTFLDTHRRRRLSLEMLRAWRHFLHSESDTIGLGFSQLAAQSNPASIEERWNSYAII